MKQYLLPFILLGTTLTMNAQTGVGTTQPKSTLDIVGDSSNAAIPDGVIAPRLTREQLIAKTNYGTDQTGAIVYITDNSGTVNATTEKVTGKGYYYFDGNVWIKLVTEIGYLDKITENGKTGYRIRGVDTTLYGETGTKAVDLSQVEESVTLKSWTGEDLGVQEETRTNDGKKYSAKGDYSFAAGIFNQVNDHTSSAIGRRNVVNNFDSHTIGSYNKVDAFNSIAFGHGNNISLNSRFSTAIGQGNVISGNRSYVLGRNNNISARYVAVVGSNNIIESASYNSFIGGAGNKLSGNSHTSLVMGSRNEVDNAQFSTTIGYWLTNKSYYGTSLGFKNTDESNTFSNQYIVRSNSRRRLLNVGNGYYVQGNYQPIKRDAFTILYNGLTGIGIDNFENTTSDVKLQVNGAIKVSSHYNCDSNNRGAIRYHNDDFYGCKSTGWVKLNN